METQIKNQVNIPNKRNFSIGEVSQICDLKTSPMEKYLLFGMLT